MNKNILKGEVVHAEKDWLHDCIRLTISIPYPEWKPSPNWDKMSIKERTALSDTEAYKNEHEKYEKKLARELSLIHLGNVEVIYEEIS